MDGWMEGWPDEVEGGGSNEGRTNIQTQTDMQTAGCRQTVI